MSITYVTVDSDEVRVITRGEYYTKDLAKQVATNVPSRSVSARLLQAIVARSQYGDETMDEYNFSEYDSIRENSKEWAYSENEYHTLEDAQDLQDTVGQQILSSDDKHDLQRPINNFYIVEHLWEKK